MRVVPRIAIALAVLALGAAPAAGATLVVASESGPDSLDPALAYAPDTWQVLVNCGEGLLAFRREPGPAGAEVVPALAASMPAVSDGGRRLTFTLRAGARFGPPADRPVRPSDIKASIERLFLVRSPGRGLFRDIRGAARLDATGRGGIAGIRAQDATGRIEFRLARPDPAFLRVLALPFAFALPRGTPPTDQGAAGLASAGPYRIAAFIPGRRIDIRRNPGYAAGAAGGAAGGPSRIEVRIGVAAPDAARLLGEGRIDYTQSRLSAAEIATATEGGARLHRHVEGTTYYFFMNTRRPPFDDLRVRRAVNLALDRAALARAFGGAAVPTDRVLPPGIPGHVAGGPPAPPDLMGARRLMERAGAVGAPVSVWGQTAEPSPGITRALARTLRRIGLRATVRLWDRQALLTSLSHPATPSQIGYGRWRGDFPDGADWFPLLLSGAAIRPGANLNYSLLDDRRVNALIDRAAATSDPAARAARWAVVERAVDARAPWAPFANSTRVDVTSARVGGFVAHTLYGFLWMRARLP